MDKKKISLDGLKKVMSPKEMQNILGGSNDLPDLGGGGGGGVNTCCSWCCTIDAHGNTGHNCNGSNDYNDCWIQAEASCPFPDYGFIVWNGC